MTRSNYSLDNFRNLPISKVEDIQKLDISDQDVLNDIEDIRVRRTNADKAIALGSSKQYTTSIVIKSKENLFRLDTDVIAIRDEMVYTKAGILIPLKCIYSVDFH
jgi:hypothetical protein